MTGDEPQTHFAHVRYAAHNKPGVRFFDPRDGHELLGVEHHPDDVAEGERRLVWVRLKEHSRRGWFTELTFETRATRRGGMAARRETHDTYAEAIEYLRGEVDGFDEYPRTDAVKHRAGVELPTGEWGDN